METIVVPVGYAEHSPPPDLAPHVACFWTKLAGSREQGEPSRVQRVLPDGCVDIIADFGHDDSPNSAELRDAFAVGTMTKPVIVEGAGPRLHVGVRFQPGSAFAALGVPASELTDQQVSLRLLHGGVQSERIERELLRHGDRSSDAALLQAMIDLVRARLREATLVPAAVRAAVQRIVDARGNLRIADVAGDIGMTRQRLARQFAIHVGVAPKMLARVMRTQAALARVDAARVAYPRATLARAVDWTAIAYDLGYYDQPHFIDDFKSLTGTTPGEWIERAR